MILFGALFAVFSSGESHGGSAKKVFFLWDIYLWHALVFATIFNGAVVYALKLYPDWMWMYFLPQSHNTTAELIYIFSFMYYLPCVLGFIAGRELKQFSFLFWILFMLILVAAEAWLIGHLFNRYSVVGTNAEFAAGTAMSLFDPNNPVAPAMNISVGLMIVYFFLVAHFYRKKKRVFLP